MVQGRFLFAGALQNIYRPFGLNPFGSGTFFILTANYYLLVGKVLIPLVQGRFLFAVWKLVEKVLESLNPFGSGTFFIPVLANGVHFPFVLIPLVQGRFLFPWLLFFLLCFNRLE